MKRINKILWVRTGKIFLWVGISCGLMLGIGRVIQGHFPPSKMNLSWPDTARAQYTYNLYLPVIARGFPFIMPLGVENDGRFTSSTLLQRAEDLGIGWSRLGNLRISWRLLQPVEGGPIDWSYTSRFETELRNLKANGIIPVVIIYDNPLWAVKNTRDDGQLTSCAAVAQDKFDDFAAFVRQVVARYSAGEFGVHNWELGNEIDEDPNVVSINSGYGCWGEMDDLYFGGRYYGEMLKVVAPVIKDQDPGAIIWMGGLLLAQADSIPPPGKVGRSELFLEGVLLSGAGPYFDVVPYHWHAVYVRYAPCAGCATVKRDYDMDGTWHWENWGGGSKGKALFLKQLLAQYGFNKTLALGETGLGCDVAFDPSCGPTPPEAFLQAQSDYLVRSVMRALSAGVSWYSWYTLDGPGWRYTGLLDENQQPKPVYFTYRFLIQQFQNADFLGEVYYDSGIEGYAFERNDQIVHVVWAINDETKQIKIPQGKLIAVYNRDGNSLALPPAVGGFFYLNVNFSPTYCVLKP